MDIDTEETVADATDRSILAATHLTDMDAGAVVMLRGLARTVDDMLSTGMMSASGKFDNVTIPTYLKFCESLGLTPAGRLRSVPEEKKQTGGSKLAKLRAVQGGKPA